MSPRKMFLLPCLALTVLASRADGQGSCQVQGFSATPCTAGGDATNSIGVSIPSLTSVTLSVTQVTIPTSTLATFQAGFSSAGSFGYLVRSNVNWAVSISGGAATWTASPISAWQSKPVSDLQWATNVGGPYVDLSESSAALGSGVPTGGTAITVYLRAKLAWSNDSAGSYSIPVVVTVTAP